MSEGKNISVVVNAEDKSEQTPIEGNITSNVLNLASSMQVSKSDIARVPVNAMKEKLRAQEKELAKKRNKMWKEVEQFGKNIQEAIDAWVDELYKAEIAQIDTTLAQLGFKPSVEGEPLGVVRVSSSHRKKQNDRLVTLQIGGGPTRHIPQAYPEHIVTLQTEIEDKGKAVDEVDEQISEVQNLLREMPRLLEQSEDAITKAFLGQTQEGRAILTQLAAVNMESIGDLPALLAGGDDDGFKRDPDIQPEV
jgi:phage host-nuclease inhibitor protein Gam